MTLTTQVVEQLAPDQSALKAASKQMKKAKWPMLGQNEATGLIWGECQGSGANPYRVMADAGDHGYKCTCPSRKFPCKHSLALMWMFAEGPGDFVSGDVPDWVSEWVGRRKKTGDASRAKPSAGAGKSVATAQTAEPEKEVDPKAEARKAAAAQKRAAETEKSIAAGLDELDQWIGDQLRLGLGAFLSDITDRCRRIAARLVDAKAASLAGRVDELPSRVMALPSEERPEAAIREFGKLALLARAWRANRTDPELRRAVGSAETREALLGDAAAPREAGVWEVLAERVSTRRDGLVAQSTWLLSLTAEAPRFALLLDFFPAAMGKRGGAFTAGERFFAELVFYPAKRPLRAIIAQREAAPDGPSGWPATEPAGDPLAEFLAQQDAAPWSLTAPILLPRGRLLARGGETWWRAAEGDAALPLSSAPPPLALGADLERAAAIWDGARCGLLSAQSGAWGRIAFHG